MSTRTRTLTDLNEYQSLALRTAPAFLKRELGPIQDYYFHACLGLTTEIAEIVEDKHNKPNVLQEVGDVMWYVALYCCGLGTSMKDLPSLTSSGSLNRYDDLVKQLGIACDCVKRHIYYGQEMDHARAEKALSSILFCLQDILIFDSNENHRLLDAGALNILKLEIRYPEAFSSAQALNRDVAKEAQLFTAK